MKIKFDTTYVRPSTSRAAKALAQELIDEVCEHLQDYAGIDSSMLQGHLDLIALMKKIESVNDEG